MLNTEFVKFLHLHLLPIHVIPENTVACRVSACPKTPVPEGMSHHAYRQDEPETSVISRMESDAKTSLYKVERFIKFYSVLTLIALFTVGSVYMCRLSTKDFIDSGNVD